MAKRRKLSGIAGKNAAGNKGVAVGRTASNKVGPKAQPKQKPKQQESSTASTGQHHQAIIPLAPEDKILLVGDGDLSFATSLIEHHFCADVTATVLEKNLEDLVEKYPQAEENILKIEGSAGKDEKQSQEDQEGGDEGGDEGERGYGRVLFGIDATKMGPFVARKRRRRGKKGNNDHENSTEHHDGSREQAANGLMDRIIFNFPHVGGKSTDVNRQVRYNQELLVSFFQRALPSLAPGGSIIVTLFEGEPYTLWNVRDLARHAGLHVERSFRFRADAYPGYRHARTFGAIRDHDGEVVEPGAGEAGGAWWKGEDRAARSYVFVRKGEKENVANSPKAKRKRGNGRDIDDDSDDE